MSTSESENDQLIAKKKKLDPSNYKRNQIKLARCKGEEYTNHRGKKVSAKAPENSCR